VTVCGSLFISPFMSVFALILGCHPVVQFKIDGVDTAAKRFQPLCGLSTLDLGRSCGPRHA
jgi:hypothetical protein